MNKMHGSIGWYVLGFLPTLTTAMNPVWTINKRWLSSMEVRIP
ncbi:MAG TPA: hypothetical protein VE732_06910 [Nitrososphaera sp.]|nr:hypothetical protein [Nitrososphaera sp.]